MDRLKQEMERQRRQFQQDMSDIQDRLKSQKEQELEQQRLKYERMLDELKKNSASDREFI